MATHPRSLSSLLANHLRLPETAIVLSISDHLNLFVLKLLSIVKLLLLFFTSFLKYLPVTFSGWLAISKHLLIYFYYGYFLFSLLRSINPLNGCLCFNIREYVFIPYLFKEDNHLFVPQRYDLNRYYSHQRSYFHPTSGKLGHENRRRVLVAEVDGEPVSGYETPIIESDKPFVPSRELSNDIAQTEDWSGLLNHCLTEIVKKLKAFHDFAVFSTVCIPWRLACSNLKWSLYPPHPWSIHFQGKNIMNHLDDGRYVLERWVIDGRYYYGCVNGWILNIGSKHISIFNLFSGTQRNLPILNRVGYLPITKPSDWYRYIAKFILFKVGEGDDFQFFAVALFGARSFIAFTRSSGFQDWICIESDDIACCRDVVLFQEQFYALCGRGKLFLCVFDRYKPFVSLVSGQPTESFRAYKYYLVKNVNHLIAVFQYGVKRFGPVTFSIYRSDGAFIREPIHLEGRALFISNGNSWTIDAAKVESCRTNSIYFVDDYWLSNNRDGHFIGVFDIANGTIEDFQFEMNKYPPNGVSPFSLTDNVGA